METRASLWRALALAASIFITMLVPLTSAKASQTLEQKIDQVQSGYQQKFDALKAEGEKLNDEAPRPNGLEGGLGIDFEVKWKLTTIKLDLPEVILKRRDIKLHLPQTSLKMTSIKWKNPEIFWEVEKVGEYPCFKSWKWHSCDIKTKVPKIRMVPREVKFDIPQFTWAMTTIKLDVPEFFTHRTEIKLHLPQFEAKDIKAEIGKHKEAATELERKASELATQQKEEINVLVRGDLIEKQAIAVHQFDDAIEKLTAAINQLKAAGINPESVPLETGTQNFVAMLADLVTKRDETRLFFDKVIAEAQAAN